MNNAFHLLFLDYHVIVQSSYVMSRQMIIQSPSLVYLKKKTLRSSTCICIYVCGIEKKTTSQNLDSNVSFFENLKPKYYIV